MDGWMDGWMDGLLFRSLYIYHDSRPFILFNNYYDDDDHLLGVNNDNTRNQRYCIKNKVYIFKYMCLLNCTILFYSIVMMMI